MNSTDEFQPLRSCPEACPACGAANTLRLLWADVQIHRCAACGLGLSTLQPDAPLYERSYFEGGEYRSYEEDAAALHANLRRFLRWIRRLVPAGRLLEIGSAYGYFLDLARPHYDSVGVEISEHAAAMARERLGVAVENVDYLTRAAPQDGYDVVCLWDTIEHLPRPDATIAKAARELGPGGVLCLTTGDFGSLLARARGRRWRQIHPPTHLFFFTVCSLTALLRRCGLEPVLCRRAGSTRRYRSMIHGLLRGERGPSRAARQILTLGNRLDFQLYLNTGDYVFVAARRPPERPQAQP